MKILMTNIDLSEIGGTQTWTEAMAKELSRRKHDVTIWSPRVGEFARERLAGFEVTDTLPLQSFDLCLVNHNICLNAIRPISGPKFYTIHGPSHGLEQPVPGAEAYVAVSEEIAATYPEYDPDVVVNGIDLERFVPVDWPYNSQPRVLIATKNAEVQEMIQEACKIAGYGWGLANYQSNPVYEMEELIPQFDIVISSGRVVYESLACNRSVIILARRPHNGSWEVNADGWVTQENVDDLTRNNCSGRTFAEQWGSAELAEHLEAWIGPESWGREHVTEHHDVRQQARQYLALVEEEVVA
tara:strand:+ start:385 stop:1281 length:897 start_codon:yes stop_codon:yes gene_type:complete